MRPGSNMEVNMKKLVLAAALSAAATTGFAGTLAEPVIEAPVIVEETNASSSAAAVWVPLLILAIVAAAIAAD
jgi:hypothetical protein|tara:strand:+ start:966 stop:1184 length:219 start_codon:yes stop_codon:yes gene_type:complete